MNLHNYGQWVSYRTDVSDPIWVNNYSELPISVKDSLNTPYAGLNDYGSLTIKYWFNGKVHNLDGPAMIIAGFYSGTSVIKKYYFINGHEFKKQCFNSIINKYNNQKIPLDHNLVSVHKTHSKSIQLKCFGRIISINRKAILEKTGFKFLKRNIMVRGGDLVISNPLDRVSRVTIPGKEVMGMATKTLLV